MEGAKEFNELLSQRIKELIPTQVVWVTVKEVDWQEKTMTAVGVTDNLEYYDVLLGLLSEFKKPVVGSRCLIGIIENKDNSFLMYAAEIEEHLITDKTGFKIHLNNGELQLNGDSFSGIVKAPELKEQLDKNTLILEKIQEVFSSWVPSPNDGGAALKGLVSEFTNLERADLSNIENKKIKHGE